MKKQIKRLGLRSETLRHLQINSLARAVGGTFPTSAECIIATGCECDTQGGGCTLPPTACLATCSC
jgi:hypothetical protein